MPRWLARFGLAAAGVLVASGLFVTAAYAESLESPNYRFDESSIGGGGLIQSSSPNFQSSQAIGDTAVGNTSSSSFQTEAGSDTTPDPTLSFGITNASADFTDFSPAAAATATSSFQVLNYTSYGYVVQILGGPPSNGNHVIGAMGSTDVSHPGTEQFGINLVHNTSPAVFGADPDHGQFGVGSATADYGTANSFRYVEGETIASAPKSSGLTTYTISYIVNVTSVTPGGSYTSDQELVCTGTY